MEIKVGIQYVNREVVVDTDESSANVEKSFADAVSKAKPAGAKGQYVQRVAVTSSMGPGVKVEPATVLSA